MTATLFVIPGSHPCWTARLALDNAGVDYRRIDLLPVVSRGVLTAAGFPTVTVPAMVVDGERVQGSREICHFLDHTRPTLTLLPEDLERRTRIEEIERWGDEVLQPIPRRLSWWCLTKDIEPLRSYTDDARLGIPIGLAVRMAPPVAWASKKLNKASDMAVRADLAALPNLIDRVDEWIRDGLLGGADEPNAADLQIAPTLRLLQTFEDIRPHIDGRPTGDLARRLLPEYPGHMPAVLPADWLEPLRAGIDA
ncbi:MAG: glutathione S-transferase family protein [Solirubrobacterales bacterium]